MSVASRLIRMTFGRKWKMLRSVVIDNAMLKCLADKINEQVSQGKRVSRKFLSEAIWAYEKSGCEKPNNISEKNQ